VPGLYHSEQKAAAQGSQTSDGESSVWLGTKPDLYQSGLDEAHPVLVEILQLNNAEYKKRFGHTSGAWRGKTPLQRNAVIAAGNLREYSAIPALIKILYSDTRPVLRGIAAWALGRIGTEQCRRALIKAAATEQDSDVLTELELALQN